MLTIYGIRNCDTVKRARKALEAAGIEHRFHDFRSDGLDTALVEAWLAELGVETLLNRQGTTWRKLDAGTQAALDGGDASAYVANASVIKRPVWEKGSERRVGFPARDEAAMLDWARA